MTAKKLLLTAATCTGKRNKMLTLPRFSAILLAAIFFSLTACNSTKSASSTASQPATTSTASTTATGAKTALPDPCVLITKAEAEEILGEPIGDPEPNSLGGNRICDYKTVKVYGGVSPYLIHIAITSEKQNEWDAGKKLYGKQMRPAPGFGDDAYFLLDDLQIYSKQRSININVLKSIDKPDHAKAVESAEKVVAQKILPRMQ
jgi:hypothetical protein